MAKCPLSLPIVSTGQEIKVNFPNGTWISKGPGRALNHSLVYPKREEKDFGVVDLLCGAERIHYFDSIKAKTTSITGIELVIKLYIM